MDLHGNSNDWSSIVTQLPGILSADFVCNELGEPAEIHILSTNARQPKNISRDVQSALAAKFGISIDHRIISIAQIPDQTAVRQPRIVYEQLETVHSRDGYSVRVVLSHAGECFEGSAQTTGSQADKLLAAARATCLAISSSQCGRIRASATDVKRVELSGGIAVVVSVDLMPQNNKREQLVGCSYDFGDMMITAVKSTLDAVNRRLAIAG